LYPKSDKYLYSTTIPSSLAVTGAEIQFDVSVVIETKLTEIVQICWV